MGHLERFVQRSLWHVLFLWKQFRSSVNSGPLFCFFSVWGLVVRKVCFRLNLRVRFPRDFIGESGDGA